MHTENYLGKNRGTPILDKYRTPHPRLSLGSVECNTCYTLVTFTIKNLNLIIIIIIFLTKLRYLLTYCYFIYIIPCNKFS